MESAQASRVLIVANRTSSTPHLIEEVGRRAKASPCEFSLLIPDVTNRKAADWTLETAQRNLRPAARGKVEGLVGGPDPFESVQEAVRDGNFDEIIISTLSKKTSKWLRRDLPRRVQKLGLPVTVISSEKDFIVSFLPEHQGGPTDMPSVPSKQAQVAERRDRIRE